MNQRLTLHANTYTAFGKDMARQLAPEHTYIYFTQILGLCCTLVTQPYIA